MRQRRAHPTGVLVLRVWRERRGEPLKARLSARPDVLVPNENVETVVGRDGVLKAVERFLDSVEAAGPQSVDLA
jgi:hypothetical protein